MSHTTPSRSKLIALLDEAKEDAEHAKARANKEHVHTMTAMRQADALAGLLRECVGQTVNVVPGFNASLPTLPKNLYDRATAAIAAFDAAKHEPADLLKTKGNP